MPETIAIAGGTGLVGRHLSKMLADAGHSVIIFSRKPKPPSGNIRFATWNPDARQIDIAALQEVTSFVNLAGAGVADKRWTDAYKQEIIRSRVDATLFLHEQIAKHAPGCRRFTAASATGIYGPDRPALTPFNEETPPYHDFLADVCVRWEEATFAAKGQYKQTVALRTGIALGKEGGAYPQLAGPMKFGIMPILGGSGRQMVSWIHVDDLAKMYQLAATTDQFDGIYNAVAPEPVSHLQLMRAIAKARGGITIPVPVPAFALNIIMGEASIEVLKSCTTSAKKILAAGFRFSFPEITAAVTDLRR